MSTQFYNTVFDHSSDATFRAWGAALSAAIVAAGTASGKHAVTTDTGQINWTTVTRPGTNTAGGYEIYKFTDSLAGSAPLFFKIEYGTGSSATFPQMWITIGTGSNGSGTLTGFTSTRNIWTRQAAISSAVTLYPTYVSSNEGSITIGFKLGSATGPNGFGLLGIGRPCNLDATLRSDAGCVLTATGSGSGTASGYEVVRFSDGTKFGSNITGTFCMVPLNITATAVAGSFQAFQHQVAYPQIYGINWMATVLSGEVTLNVSDTATLYGVTSHTYVSMGAAVTTMSATNGNTHAAFMLYE